LLPRNNQPTTHHFGTSFFIYLLIYFISVALICFDLDVDFDFDFNLILIWFSFGSVWF